jgi:hypothetical protein
MFWNIKRRSLLDDEIMRLKPSMWFVLRWTNNLQINNKNAIICQNKNVKIQNVRFRLDQLAFVSYLVLGARVGKSMLDLVAHSWGLYDGLDCQAFFFQADINFRIICRHDIECYFTLVFCDCLWAWMNIWIKL